MSTDKRWRQRYGLYQKALVRLEKAAAIQSPTDLEKAGIIQYFALAFELAWKTLKDYLEYTGRPVNAPRAIIKEAYAQQLVENGHTWLHMLDTRNAIAHTYDEELANETVAHIKTYVPLLQSLNQLLQSK